jgi:hypothetical protein
VQAVLRAALMVALFCALSTPVWPQASSSRQTPTRWYDAYQEGLRAVQKRDWAAAEKQFLQAKATGPQPARRVFTYGDSYIPFLPDYYLGVVYLNTNRSRDAETAFQLVRKQNVITAKDPEYVAFERQGREATFNRAFTQAQQLTAAGNFEGVRAALQEALTTNIDNAKVQMFSRENETQLLAKAAPPNATTAPPSTAKLEDSPVQNAPPPVAKTAPPPVAAPVATNSSVVKTPVGRIPVPRPQNETVKDGGVIVPPRTASAALRNGVLAFFSGDYGGAIPLLQGAAQQPGADPKAQILLACAKVGLVLTGGGDATTLRQTQAEFQSAALDRYLTPADRRFISPKILQQLERR